MTEQKNKQGNRPKKEREAHSMLYGKVPPNAREIEEAILGAILLEKHAFDIAAEFLKPESFYVDAHQRIFRVMQSMAQRSMQIEMLSVAEELIKTEELELIGGPYAITKLTNSVVSSASLEQHCRIVLQKFMKRELIRLGGMMVNDGYEDSVDVFEQLEQVDKQFTEIVSGTTKSNYKHIDQGLVKMIQRVEELRNNKSDFTGVPSGFPSLDKLTYGWQATDLIILAARPAVGKTAFALNLARNAALHTIKPTPVAIFSLEMSSEQLIQRIVSAESEIWIEKIARGRMEDHEMRQLYQKGVDKLSRAPIYIDDSAALNIYELRARARRMARKHNIGLIIIDYLQLMSGSSENRNSNREQEISNISRNLKGLAKELNIPIIALSQLSRDVEKRRGEIKMPQLSDLRESGAIEQDADVVMFMYRPEYYDINSNEMGESNKGETHLRIAKHRKGNLDTVKLRALLHIQKFVDDNSVDGITRQLGEGKWTPVALTTNSKDLNFDDGFNEEF